MTSPTPVKVSKARDPKSVVLERLAGGAFAALCSDGHTYYRVERVGDGWQCSCAGFGYRGQCCHSLAAALPRCFWCLSAVDVQSFTNGYDNRETIQLYGETIQLCGACLTATIPDCCAEH